MWRGSIAALPLLALLGGCGGEGDGGGEVARTDSAGIAIVVNGGGDRPLERTFDKVFSVGGAEDGPEAFARVYETGVDVDGAGNLYVLDAGNYRVDVFDRAGTYVRSFGHQGGGPGEFRFPSDMAVAGDGTAAIYDFDKGGFVRFAADGSPLAEMRVSGALQRKVELTSFGLIGATRLAAGETDTTRLIAIAGSDTVRIAEVGNAQPKPVQLGCMTVAMPPVFARSIVWAARGDTIGVNDDAAYAIRVFERERPVAIFRRDIDPRAATAALAARELGSDSMRFVAGTIRCAVSAEKAAEATGFADVVPQIRNLMLAPDGTWWVQRRVAGPEKTRIDLLSADGEYLGTLAADAPWPAAFRAADEVVAVERDGLGVARVVVYRITDGTKKTSGEGGG